MNKTVNINLAGIFFHIDEDAYLKLQAYLEAIKRSFAKTPGYDEIIADIEARIGELFSEKAKSDRQVISLREVEEVITIMGQPEDYMVDEEIFEDQTFEKSTKTGKQLFRDCDNAYLGGVSSGLGHYLGIQAAWVRVLWVLLTLGSSGAFILIYIALWLFVPEAKTTAEKLAMRGEPVNISNIEKKIKEGFDDVSGRVKNINYEKYGYRAKAGVGSAAGALGNAVSILLNVFVKFVGILILLFAGTVLIGLFIGLFTIGTFGIIEAPWTDYLEMATPGGSAIWILSILSFFAIGIPFFFLFILGLKILVNNLKSIGKMAIMVLVGLWIISVLGLSIYGIMQATEHAYDGEVVITEEIPITPTDTVFVGMKANPDFDRSSFRNNDFELKYDANNEKVIFSEAIRLIVKSTRDSVGRMEIIKTAEGRTHKDARDRAANIKYNTGFENNQLLLNSYFTTSIENKYRDQEVEVILFLPIGAVLYADKNTNSFHRNMSYYEDILIDGDEERFLYITESGTECKDCPEDEFEDEWEHSDEEWLEEEEDTLDAQSEEETTGIRVDISENGIQLNDQKTGSIRVNKDEVVITSSSEN